MENQSKTVIPLRTDDIIRQEAADWLVKLDNGLDSKGLSPNDLAELRTWLANDPRHGEILQKQASVWSDLDIYAEGLTKYGNQPAPGLSSLFDNSLGIGKAAAFACTLLIAVAAWLYISDNVPEDVTPNFYSTDVGAQSVRKLSDGSTAHLNTDTLIEIDYGDAERKITLLRGEVMFDVAHDPDRPFIVYAAGSSVTAVGTKFIVRLASDKILVSVAEGQVKLSSQPAGQGQKTISLPNQPVQEVILVSAGQTAEINTGEPDNPLLNDVEDNELQRKFSWTNGRIVFVDETLESIINEVNRYTTVRVVIVDPELRDIRLGGRFEIGDTEALLEAIEISRREIQVSRNIEGNMIIISRSSG